MTDRWIVWAARVAWALLPLNAAPELGGAIADWEASSRAAVSVALWAAWAATLVATLVPHPAALTAWRVMAPAAGAAVALAALAGEPSVVAAVDGVFAAALPYSASVAAVFVNGPAYANERRYPLRPPGWVLVGPAALAWVVLVGGPTIAVLLLADRRWIAGAAVAIAAAAAASIAGRALHGLARRWLVFVPAGIVVHDPLTLADPVLFQRPGVGSIGPAPAQPAGDRVDITAGALGLALELRFTKPTDVFVITKPGRRPTAETVTTLALLVAPSRAAAVLQESDQRGYTIS